MECDISRAQVETFGGGQQRHRGNRLAVVIDQQGLKSNGAVHVLRLVQVADSGCGRPQAFDGLLPSERWQRESAVFIERTLERKRGQGLVGVAPRFAQGEIRSQDDVAGAFETRSQLAVGVECCLGLGHQARQLSAPSGGGAGWIGVSAQHLLQAANVAQPPVDLGFKKEHGINHNLGFGGRQLVNQPGMNITWPGPATDVGNTPIIDGDDGDPVGRLVRVAGAGAGDVIKPPFQGAN